MLPSSRTFGLLSLAAFTILLVLSVLLASMADGLAGSFARRAILVALLVASAIFLYALAAVGVRLLFHALAALIALHSPGRADWSKFRWVSDLTILCLWGIWTLGLLVAALSPWGRMLLEL